MLCFIVNDLNQLVKGRKVCEWFPGRPRGSPVQYTFTCKTGELVLYGRPSRSPWQSNCIPGSPIISLAIIHKPCKISVKPLTKRS